MSFGDEPLKDLGSGDNKKWWSLNRLALSLCNVTERSEMRSIGVKHNDRSHFWAAGLFPFRFRSEWLLTGSKWFPRTSSPDGAFVIFWYEEFLAGIDKWWVISSPRCMEFYNAESLLLHRAWIRIYKIVKLPPVGNRSGLRLPVALHVRCLLPGEI